MTRIMDERVEKYTDLNNYPEHLRGIVEIILEEGENLSDGIVYYATQETVQQFAERIYSHLKEIK